MGGASFARAARAMISAGFVVLALWIVPVVVQGYSAVRAQSAGVRVPILVYHNIDDSGSAYAVTPELLDAQCRWLSENGYTTITLWQFWDAAFGGAALPANPIMLTNDDGWTSAMTFAEILGRYGMVGNYFINNYSPLTADQIWTLTQHGPVASHTATHQYLSKLEYTSQLAEVTDNTSYIAGITGSPVQFIAWPFGDYNQSAIEAASAAGIVGGFGLGGTAAYIGSLNPFGIPRIMMEASDTLDTFIAKVTAW